MKKMSSVLVKRKRPIPLDDKMLLDISAEYCYAKTSAEFTWDDRRRARQAQRLRLYPRITQALFEANAGLNGFFSKPKNHRLSALEQELLRDLNHRAYAASKALMALTYLLTMHYIRTLPKK